MKALVLLALSALGGCAGFEVSQRAVFSDEDGGFLQVEYGRSEGEHETTYLSPVDGKVLPFKSKLVVRVTFDESVADCVSVDGTGAVVDRLRLAGESFVAWQYFNILKAGTMYRTDDERWMFLADGLCCVVYCRPKQGEDYVAVYNGTLCETPKLEQSKEKNGKVRDAPRRDKVFKAKK